MTLGAFLFYLNMVPPAVMRMHTPVLERYLGTLLPVSSIGKKRHFIPFGKFVDLKSRYENIKKEDDQTDSENHSTP
jgi:hypothetical protein